MGVTKTLFVKRRYKNNFFTLSWFLEFSQYKEILAFVFTHLGFNSGQSSENKTREIHFMPWQGCATTLLKTRKESNRQKPYTKRNLLYWYFFWEGGGVVEPYEREEGLQEFCCPFLFPENLF